MNPSVPLIFTELSKVDIVCVVHIFEADFEKNLTGSFLRNGISKAADWSLGMVDDTSVIWIFFLYIIGVVKIQEVLLLWYCMVCPNNMTLG